LERRQAVLDQDIGRVASGLVSFLDKHFAMSDADYQQFTNILRAESTTSQKKDDDDMSDGEGDGDDAEEGNENRKSRKRRRSDTRPAPNDDYNQAGSGEVKKPVLSMKAMLQELMNKSLTSMPWVNWVSLNWFEWFVQMLISAGIAEEHPDQHGLIRLADFL
jgi:hypothetical protein